jgi:hypothetical protein
MLLNVAAHSIRNVKVSIRERHITYSITKHTASHISFVHFLFFNGIHFVTLYVMRRLCFENLRFGTLTLCSATLCSNILTGTLPSTLNT